MQYLMLIYSNEKTDAERSESANREVYGAYMKFTEEVKAAGVMQGGNALESTSQATTVRVRDGRTLTTDGPFAETKEQLGGYYLLDCENLDQAIAFAAKIPTAKFGSIEVRPIMNFD